MAKKPSPKPPTPAKGATKTSSPAFWVLAIVFGALALYLRYLNAQASSALHLPRPTTVGVPARHRWNVSCSNQYQPFVRGCHKRTKCGRAVRDAFISDADVTALRGIADHGMAGRSMLGGPTIMDINTGFVKDADGLTNLYRADPPTRFSRSQYDLYKRTIESIRQALMEEFELSTLYFTAPTFITRIIGNASWTAAEIHDEYWHPHVDKNNTWHYDYSGLVYLSDYGIDFTGGLFAFIDDTKNHTFEPARGRLMMFHSGMENLHQVRPVETGARYVMSMWFSCDERKQFKNFLDGKMHERFTRGDDEEA
ncbi:hypothetical protein SPRG_06854 [Saprolegnia parasitica CBS 223.65]|uniref:Fe2OG dioxygenase domain-containing protein n=1 Tax=Saprolegnia parasitica (strain CBS 223.65) TaxID=695850 RepID=A0A067CM13_SAPPC|nr:hypothetical protein SPRG_06854 [Saprolegnia parasitica CBS 223.65]KDO27586.1 hypothetical protein SPRG_06854 [Saprolegnia parasitica CBS 223.65]|eukprot:XP_012201711.1 hypothetical protein SPRG_06854 [Saprolegnia parasitica CBS 223.65]